MPAPTRSRSMQSRRRPQTAAPRFTLAPVAAGVLCALLAPAAQSQTTAPVLPTQLKGGVVSGANAPTVNAAGNTMTIQQTAQRGVIEWSNFSIGAGGKVDIQQPGSTAVLLNRVIGNTAGSRIDGALTANGRVMILDPSGLTFGANSTVQVGSLIGAAMDLKTTVGVDPYAAFLAGGDVSLAPTGLANVTVESGASIGAASQGGVVLLSPQGVAVNGAIDAPQGQVVLAASGGADIPLGTSGFINLKLVRATGSVGSVPTPIEVAIGSTGTVTAAGGDVRVEVSGSIAPGDGINIPPQIIQQGLIDTSVSTGNGGNITLQGGDNGRVILQNDLIATGGKLLVNDAGQRGGNITVDGADITTQQGLDRLALPQLLADGKTGGGTVRVGSANTLSLRINQGTLLSADAIDTGDGGTVAALATAFNPAATQPVARVDFGVAEVYGTLQARGGQKGGNGGKIETSATALATRIIDGDAIIAGSFDASARGGTGVAGTWTLDPFDVTISNAAPVAVNGVFTPTGPDANINAADISAALDKGTSITISTGAPGNTGNQGGDITILTGTRIVRSAPGGQTTLTLVADRNINFANDTAIDATGGGATSVNLLTDRGGNGQGSLFMGTGATIRTAGGSVFASGGIDPASGFARNLFGGTGIALNGAVIDTTGPGATGNIGLRGEGTDSEGLGNGIDLVSTTLTGNDITLIGRAQSGNGVLITNSFINSRRPGGAQGGFGVDIRGVASSDFGIPTGVSFSNTLITLDGGAMQVLGVGRGVESQPVNAIGISFDNLTVQTAPSHTATITLVGEAAATSGNGMLGGANGSFNISAGEAGATGANVVIGANAGPNGSALAFQAGPPTINTTGAVNLRPAGVVTTNGDQDGSIFDRVDVPVAIGTVSADQSFSFSVPDTWLLDSRGRDPAGRIAARNLVIGSATHSGEILLGTNALNSNVISDITLQNQGAASQGIVLDGNASGPHVSLMSGGPVTQITKVVADALVLVGNGPGSDVTLDDQTNLFGVLSFDGLGNLSLAKTGALIVGGSTVSPTAGVATGFDPATGRFTTTTIGTNRATDSVLLRTVGTGTTVTLGNPIVTSGAGSQINIVTPDGLVVGPGANLATGAGGRWQVWTTTWPTEGSEGLQGSGQTAHLYGCNFGDTTVCSGSGAAIVPTDSGYRYVDRPTAQVAPTPISFVQGQTVPPIPFTVTGLVNGDTAAGAFTGALGTTATSGSAPGAYPALPGTLASRLGYRLTLAVVDTLPVTVLAVGPRFTDLTPGSGRARGFDFDRLDFETSSEVNGRNLSRSLMCMAPGALRRQTDAGEGVDALGMEWGRVRNQPHLSSCLEIGDDNQCAAF